MKKSLFIVLLTIGVLFSSCYSFERNAHHALRDEIKATVKNPDSFKISDEETVFSDDSIVVISFTGTGENGLGGLRSNQYEYFYGYVSGEKKSLLKEVKLQNSIENTIKGLDFETDSKDMDAINAIMDAKKCSKNEAKSSYISMIVSMGLIMFGHNVK